MQKQLINRSQVRGAAIIVIPTSRGRDERFRRAAAHEALRRRRQRRKTQRAKVTGATCPSQVLSSNVLTRCLSGRCRENKSQDSTVAEKDAACDEKKRESDF